MSSAKGTLAHHCLSVLYGLKIREAAELTDSGHLVRFVRPISQIAAGARANSANSTNKHI